MRTRTRRLLGALLPAALLGATLTASASGATPEPDVPWLANGSFEEEVADGAIPGWRPLWTSSTSYYSLTQERASDGLTSIQISDTSTSGGGGLVADAVSVEAGQEYVLSFDQYYRSGALNPTIYFDDADGTVITQPYQTVRSTVDSWERVEVVVTAPEGAAWARPSLYSSVGGVVDVFVDDVTFAPYFAVPELPTSPVNPGFEADLVGDAIPGWGVDGSVWDQQSYAVVDDVARSGTRSLWLRDDSTVRGLSIQSEPFAVEPGVVYDVTAQLRVERDQLGLYVRFFDAAGNRLTNAAVWQAQTAGEWQEARHTITSPDTAVTATLVLNSSVSGRGLGHVDDVAVVATDEEPPPPPLPPRASPEEIVAQHPNLSHVGAPVRSRIITNMITGEEDGVSMTYGVYRGNVAGGQPAVLVVAETLTGDIVRTIELEGTDHATEIRRSTTGKIHFVTSNYTFWEYDPETHEARNVGLINPESPGDGYGWSMAAAEDGKMYIGSYPEGLLYLFDPADDSITNLGRIDETQAYIRALAYDLETGVLYAGVGGSAAQIWKVEPDGTKTPLLSEDNAPGAQDHSFITTFTLVGGKLFARGGVSALFVLDTVTDEVEYWTGEERQMFGYNVVQRPDDPSKFIFTLNTFWEYDAETRTIRDLGVSSNGFLNEGRWMELDDPEWPGWTLVAASGNGVVRYNLETGRSEGQAIDYTNPITVQKLFRGPDGMYASGYMTGLARFDSVTGEFGPTVQAGQYESAAVRDGKLLLGAYGHGRLMEYDPSTGAPPRQVFTQQNDHQDRPFGLSYDEENDRIFMGTVAHYGHNQGALTVYDFASGERSVYTDEIVEEQSVIDVLYHDGLVYLGTTIDGGLGAPASGQTESHFIVFDPDAGEVVHDVVPVAGDEGVTGLMVGPDGLIWAVSEDTVFKWDPQAEEIVYSEKLLGNRYGTNTVWAWAYLAVGSDGNVYGTNRASFFTIDAETMEYTEILPIGNYAASDENGDILFANNINVYKYDVPDEDAEPVAVAPRDVVFADGPGTDDDSYTVPDVEGVEYLVDGDVVAAGTYPGTGSVSVTARAGEGYVLAEGATTAWRHTFDDVDPGQPGDVAALRVSTDGYVAAGEIAGPIAHQLRGALDQAERHLQGDRVTPAVRALERYVRHLENPKRPDTLSEAAQAGLISQAGRLIAALT